MNNRGQKIGSILIFLMVLMIVGMIFLVDSDKLKKSAPKVDAAALWQKYQAMTADEIVGAQKEKSAGALVYEYIALDKERPADARQEVVDALERALIEKADEFTDEDLATLINDSDTSDRLDMLLAKIYTVYRHGASRELIGLLELEQYSPEVRGFLIRTGNLVHGDLEYLLKKKQNRGFKEDLVRLIIPQRADAALEIADKWLSKKPEKLEDEECRALVVAVAHYCKSEGMEPEELAKKVDGIMAILACHDDERVREYGAASLARMLSKDEFESYRPRLEEALGRAVPSYDELYNLNYILDYEWLCRKYQHLSDEEITEVLRDVPAEEILWECGIIYAGRLALTDRAKAAGQNPPSEQMTLGYDAHSNALNYENKIDDIDMGNLGEEERRWINTDYRP